MRRVGSGIVSCFVLASCATEAFVPVRDARAPAADASGERAPAGPPSWPAPERFAETATSLGPPVTLALVRRGDDTAVALARREDGGWQLSALFHDGTLPSGCERAPCPWPVSLTPVRPLAEPPPLPAELIETVAYARTLLAFEGPLSLEPDADTDRYDVPGLPDSAWSFATPRAAPDLVPYLEQLRRYHPVGGCSMDEGPQLVARMRATAAAQAGRSGWAVQGWVDTVAYFSSSRMAWSSYGQSHPSGHLELLEMVGVDPERLMLGLLVALASQRSVIGLADARRIAPDLGPSFAARLRALAADAAVDPLNRALLFAVVAELPVESDPGYASLPSESQALLAHWTR
ncbi:MAG: hypothetical protein KF729_18300 [Sandaracinaceae bacterium]|nr:hypothetical protein [Sandaracinaceae bacterium]